MPEKLGKSSIVYPGLIEPFNLESASFRAFRSLCVISFIAGIPMIVTYNFSEVCRSLNRIPCIERILDCCNINECYNAMYELFVELVYQKYPTRWGDSWRMRIAVRHNMMFSQGRNNNNRKW